MQLKLRYLPACLLVVVLAACGGNSSKKAADGQLADTAKAVNVAPPIPRQNIHKGRVEGKLKTVKQNPPLDTKEKPVNGSLIN